MSEHTPAFGAQKAVLGVMALAFAFMLGTSLWQRFAKPDLVVPASAGRMSDSSGAPAANMNEISQLMAKIQQDPGDFASMLHLAEHFMDDQNWPAAENFLRRAAVSAPSDPKPLYLLGVALHNQGQNAESALCLERVLGLRDEASVRYSLAVLYSHYLQNPVMALEHLRAALAMPELSAELEKLVRAEMATLAAKEPEAEKGAPAKPGAQ